MLPSRLLSPRLLSSLRLGSQAALLCVLGVAAPAWGQRHSFGSAPPTVAPPLQAPVHTAPAPPTGPFAPVSSGMGAIQFTQGGGTVPAPQTLLRQLTAEDEHTRLAALASLGVPGQYLAHGHVPTPHSLQLELVPLGGDNELDALLTVELDQHVVSAIFVPEDGLWRHTATLSFASAFNSGNTTPSNFLRPQRSWLEPGHYRAVYHATVTGSNGDFTENEADLRLVHGHAAVVLSFVSGLRQCDATGLLRPAPRSCELLQRWFEPDPADPVHRFMLITAAGHSPAHDATDVLAHSRNFRLTRLRSFACQPYTFVESAEHFEPTGPNAPCPGHDTSGAPRTAGPPTADHPATPAEHAPALP